MNEQDVSSSARTFVFVPTTSFEKAVRFYSGELGLERFKFAYLPSGPLSDLIERQNGLARAGRDEGPVAVGVADVRRNLSRRCALRRYMPACQLPAASGERTLAQGTFLRSDPPLPLSSPYASSRPG
jgi:hypothetical protein